MNNQESYQGEQQPKPELLNGAQQGESGTSNNEYQATQPVQKEKQEKEEGGCQSQVGKKVEQLQGKVEAQTVQTPKQQISNENKLNYNIIETMNLQPPKEDPPPSKQQAEEMVDQEPKLEEQSHLNPILQNNGQIEHSFNMDISGQITISNQIEVDTQQQMNQNQQKRGQGNEEVARLEKQFNNLSQQLELQKTNYEKLLQEKTQYQKTNNQLTQSIQRRKKEIKQIRTKWEITIQDKNQFQRQLFRLNQDNQSLKNLLESNKYQIDNLDKQKLSYQYIIGTKQEQILDLLKKYQLLNKNYSELKTSHQQIDEHHKSLLAICLEKSVTETNLRTGLQQTAKQLESSKSKHQRESIEKNHVIKQLQTQLQHYKQFQQFKLKQQLQLTNLTASINQTTETQYKKLTHQYEFCQRAITESFEQLNAKAESKWLQNSASLNQLTNIYQARLQNLLDHYKQSIDISHTQKQSLLQDFNKLRHRLAQVQNCYSQALRNCYHKIDVLSGQVGTIQLQCVQKQHCWDTQRQQLIKMVYQFANTIASLQNELQSAKISEIELRGQYQYQISWSSQKLQAAITELHQIKTSQNKKISSLKTNLENLQDQISISQVEAQNRQKDLIQSFSNLSRMKESQKNKYDSFAEQNKFYLIAQLKNILKINQDISNSKLASKDSIISFEQEKHDKLAKQFKQYQEETQLQLQKLKSQKFQLQTQLAKANAIKQSKLKLQIQYTKKQDLWNDILYRLNKKGSNPNLKDVIDCFLEIDTKRVFESFTKLLIASNNNFQAGQDLYRKSAQDIVLKDKQIAMLWRAVNQIEAQNNELKAQLQNYQSTNKAYQQLQTELIEFKTRQIQHDLQIEKLKSQIELIKGSQQRQIHTLNKENFQYQRQISQGQLLLKQKDKIIQELKLSNERKQQIIEEKGKAIADLTQRINSNTKQATFRNHQQIKKGDQVKKTTIQAYQRQIDQYKKIIATLKSKLQQQCDQSKTNQKRQLDLVRRLEAQLKANKENLITAQRSVQQKQQHIKRLLGQIDNKNKEIYEANQKIRPQKAQKEKVQVKKNQTHPLTSARQSFSRPQNTKSIIRVNSPQKFETKPNPQNSIILVDDFMGQNSQSKIFKDSNILAKSQNHVLLKSMIEKFTSKMLVAAELKFKLLPNKLDYSPEFKNLSSSNFALIFRRQDTVFGAVSFNKEATEQQSAILFNLSNKVMIQPASSKNSWTPIKSDSFYLTFGVQQAKYIWKSKMFSITDSKSSLKYFEPSKPLVPNLLNVEKVEVQQFQVYLLKIVK